MKNIKLYPDLQSAIGQIEDTDFLASLPDVDEYMVAGMKQWGEQIEVVQKGPNFIQPKYMNFYIEAIEDGTVSFQCRIPNINLSYKINDAPDWTECTFTDNKFTIGLEAGQKLYLYGNNTMISHGHIQSTFSSTNKINVGGDITSLINYTKENFPEQCFSYLFNSCVNLISAEHLKLPEATSEYCYASLFSGCSSLVNAPALPAKVLSKGCYSYMFSGCTSLTESPELPATELGNYCYSHMFEASSLVNAPELPAEVVAPHCYEHMFFNCESLVNPPSVLPCTNLSTSSDNVHNGCYESMFEGCTSLTHTPELEALYLERACYRAMFKGCTSLTTPAVFKNQTLSNGISFAFDCYAEMYSGCTSLQNPPSLPYTTICTGCYYKMFEGCTSLTIAPELPAYTLENMCYHEMFKGCSSLTNIKALFVTEPSSTYTSNWVQGVAASGTFIKSGAATWTTTGPNGVPEGWTVVTV